MTSSTQKRVLMLGLDSVDIEYLQSYLPVLTNLRQLFADGQLVPLKTTAGAIDASVWPTFCLATLPGEHGMYFPFQWDPAHMNYRRLTSGWLPYEPFWHELGARGIPVGLLDVPMVPPPPPRVAGVTYYNWQSQDEGEAVKLNRDIERRFGKSPLGYDISADKTKRQLQELRKNCVRSLRKRGDLASSLMQQSDWRLFLVCFSELHRAGHYLCPGLRSDSNTVGEDDQLVSVYQALDETIGRLIEGLDLENTSLVVFSLHGMGPNNSQAHFVPMILDRLNTIRPTNGTRSKANQKQHSLMRRLRGSIPGQLQHRLAALVSQAARDWVVNRAFTSGFDWQRTPGFAVASGGQGYIRCNLKGREAQGCLEPDSVAHKDYLRLLRDTFLSLKVCGTDQRLVKEMVVVEEKFPGPQSHLLPDVSIIWEDIPPAQAIYSETLETIEARIRTGRCGNHRPNAFALVMAKGSATECVVVPSHIVELGRYVEHLLTC